MFVINSKIFFSLTKVRLALSVVFSTLAGYILAADKILVSSFDMNAINRIRETDPLIPTGWLVAERSDGIQILDRAKSHNHSSINPWDDLVDESLIEEAHSRGLNVNVWTVDDESRISELAEWGVDGIITNFPGLAIEVLNQ